MKSPEYRDFLNNILEAINDTQAFIGGMTYEEFVKDQKTLNAVTFSIQMIGEAAKHIPKNVKTENPDFPWEKMAKMSDDLILRYFAIDNKALYQTATQTIPPLKAPIEKILKNQPQT